MDEITELRFRVAALETALQAAIKDSPTVSNAVRQALQVQLDEIAKGEPPPREPGFQRVVEMYPRSPVQDGRKASLARLLKLIS